MESRRYPHIVCIKPGYIWVCLLHPGCTYISSKEDHRVQRGRGVQGKNNVFRVMQGKVQIGSIDVDGLRTRMAKGRDGFSVVQGTNGYIWI